MKRKLFAGLACLAVIAAAQTVHGLVAVVRPAPVPMRVAQAEAVVVGRVTAIEAKGIKTERYPGDAEKAEYTIAIVKIDEALSGAKGLTHIKVGFLPAVGGAPAPIDNERQIKPIRPTIRPPVRFQPVTLVKDQEVCLYLQPHHKEAFYIIANNYDAVDKKAANFTQEVAEAKKYGQMLNDPMTALKAKEAEDRFKAASLLLTRYRLQRPGTKQEPIDAAESKLILEALADANWEARATRFGEPNALASFQQLGLTPKDGWTQPADFQQFGRAAKEWLKSNAATYRIQRFVADEKK